MKTYLSIYILFYSVLLLFLYGCTKNKIIQFSDNNATIIKRKYACGTACDATGFIIQTSGNEIYTPLSLQEEFKINGLVVKIEFKRTGKFPQPFTAPDYEQIIIERIEK